MYAVQLLNPGSQKTLSQVRYHNQLPFSKYVIDTELLNRIATFNICLLGMIDICFLYMIDGQLMIWGLAEIL